MSEYKALKSDSDLETVFDDRRRGVTDPVRIVATELRNITDVLLELLKNTRIIANNTK